MKGLTPETVGKITGGAVHIAFLSPEGTFTDYEYLPSASETSGKERTGRRAAEAENSDGRGTGVNFADAGGAEPKNTYIKDKEQPAVSSEILSIVTDSRSAEKGSLFGAIRGERVDGHRFIAEVFDKGAVCVLSEKALSRSDLISEKTAQKASKEGRRICRCYIRVRDTQEALRRAAERYLKILKIPVVGITGSVGKTSTKEMIASVLGTHFRVLKTEGNFNNGLGLPLTVFRIREEDEIAVLEMGVSHFGDMDQLAEIARPDTMVITNIGTCHLEYLKDRDGVMREKTEVFRYMKPSGHVLLNGNDDKLRLLQQVNGTSPFWFGVDPATEGAEDLCAGRLMEIPGQLDPSRLVYAKDIRPLGLEGTDCEMVTPRGAFRMRIPVPGIHNVSNAAAATAVGLLYGLSPEEIRSGIESAKTISGRLRIRKGKNLTIIDDCYNANPVSMKSSLAVLSGGGKAGSGRRVAILGDMGELGEEEARMHELVGRYAASCCDRLIAVGKLSKSLYEAALKENPALSAVWYPDVDSFLSRMRSEVLPGDMVLVKASHFMGFQRIVAALEENGF